MMSTSTPWGRAQTQKQIVPGVLWVSTAGHGGLLVSKAWADEHLSEAARKAGCRWNDGYAYEEDCDWAIVCYENPDLVPILDAKTGSRTEPGSPQRVVGRWHPLYCADKGIPFDRHGLVFFLSPYSCDRDAIQVAIDEGRLQITG